MSNLSDLVAAIKNIGAGQLNCIDLIGATVGTIADFAGGIGGVISVIQLVSSLFGGSNNTDPTQAALQDVLTTIQNEFHQLNLDIKAEDLLQQWHGYDTWLVPAGSVYDQLGVDATANPPLDNSAKSDRMITCRNALTALGATDQWLVVQNYQVYFVPTNPWLYEDNGLPNTSFPFTYENPTYALSFVPPADSNGLVFNYLYILPAYLRSIMIYLAEGAALYPNFSQISAYMQDVRSAANTLLTMYNTIKGGIVNVAAPSQNDVIPYQWVQLGDGVAAPAITTLSPPSAGYMGNSSWALATITTGSNNTAPPPTDYNQPYGAVNLYSGYSSVGSYPSLGGSLSLGFPPGYKGPFPPPHTGSSAWPPSDWYLGFYGKYLLLTLARKKDVYRGIGLTTVRQVINRLKTLVGDTPLAGPDFGDWSLREVFNVLGYPANHLLKARTVRNLANYLASSPPASPLPTPISLRQLLEGTPPS